MIKLDISSPEDIRIRVITMNSVSDTNPVPDDSPVFVQYYFSTTNKMDEIYCMEIGEISLDYIKSHDMALIGENAIYAKNLIYSIYSMGLIDFFRNGRITFHTPDDKELEKIDYGR